MTSNQATNDDSTDDQNSTTHDGDARIDHLMEMVTNLQHTVTNLQSTIRLQDARIRQLEHCEFVPPDIPTSYWISDAGQSEEFAFWMDKYLKKFQKDIIDIANGDRTGICLSNRAQEVYEYEEEDFLDDYNFLDDYEVLLPYWEELGDALHSSKCIAALEHGSFSMTRIKAGKRMMDALAPGLQLHSFKSLRFEGNVFGKDGIAFVADLIKHNPSLNTVFLMDNPIENPWDVSRLCGAIENHQSLERIMIKCVRQSPSDVLLPIITASSRLRRLELPGNSITNMGRVLSNLLATNPCLEHLDLRDNQLNDRDAVLIADSLKSNTNLTRLHMSSSEITRVGNEAIFKTIFNAESLDSVVDCNHTCTVSIETRSKYIDGKFVFPDLGHSLPSVINLRYGHPEHDELMSLLGLAPNTSRNMKYLTLLSAPYEKTVNIHLLNGFPVQMMPNVLELVQQYPDTHYNVNESNTLDHWDTMSELRPDVLQDDLRPDENDDEHSSGGDEQDGGLLDIVDHNDDDDDYYYDDDWEQQHPDDYVDNQQEEVNPKIAQIKRSTLVFELLRGCIIQSM